MLMLAFENSLTLFKKTIKLSLSTSTTRLKSTNLQLLDEFLELLLGLRHQLPGLLVGVVLIHSQVGKVVYLVPENQQLARLIWLKLISTTETLL